MASLLASFSPDVVANLKNDFEFKRSDGTIEIIGHCHIWTGAKTTLFRRRTSFYGRFYASKACLKRSRGRGEYILVHILAYFLHTGLLPSSTTTPTMEISHLCGNSLCCNPVHLNLETHETNTGRKHCHDRGHCIGHVPMCIF